MVNTYLFLDDHWIAEKTEITRRFHPVEKETGNPILLKQEGERSVGPYSFTWGRKTSPYNAWLGSYNNERNKYPAFLTTSPDGLNWDPIRQETDALDIGDGNISGVSYLHDTGENYPGYPYLCMACFRKAPDYDRFHIRFRRSKDGVHWEKFNDDPVWGTPGDVLNIFWDEHKKRFAAYYKIYRIKGTTTDGKPYCAYCGSFKIDKNEKTCKITGYGRMEDNWGPITDIGAELIYGGDSSNDGGGVPTDEILRTQRVIGYADSADFLRWENERIIITPPDDAPLGDQYYGLTVSQYHGLYIGLLQHFNSLNGLIKPILAWSYDGVNFKMNTDDFILREGGAGTWDAGMVFGQEFLDTGDGRMCLYYGSMGKKHIDSVDLAKGAVGRAWLRKDGFASLSGGRFTTRPLRVCSPRLSLNMKGRAGLTVKNENGEVLYSGEVRGDHVNITPPVDLAPYINHDVTLSFDLSDGELFSASL